MSIQYVETSRGTFATLARGDIGAPVALCLHGFPDIATTFTSMLDGLADAGFRAVAPWMRGYAPSVIAGPYDPDSIALDAIALSESLSPSKPIAIIGHDWGAVATYGATSMRPERFTRAVTMAVPHPLAFVRNLPRAPAQLRRSWYMMAFQLPLAPHLAMRNDGALIDRLWRDWSPGFTAPQDHLHDVKQSIATGMPGPFLYYRQAVRPLVPALRRIRRAGGQRVGVPTRFLIGDTDGCIGLEAGAGQRRYFEGEFDEHVVHGAGHFLHLERPDEVLRLVVDWLR